MFYRILLGVALFTLLAACQSGPTLPPVITDAPIQSLTPTTAADAPKPSTIPASPTTLIEPSPSATAAPDATQAPTASATPLPVTIGPDNFPADVNPLTGLKVADTTLLDRRPVAVKIHVAEPYVRPAWGLSFADLVFEYYHTAYYGPARLHAIFYGQDAELAGPIRSGRFPDDDLIRMYKSIFAFGSADEVIYAALVGANYADRLVVESGAWFSLPCPPAADHPLCRYEPQGASHLLGSTAALSQYITNKKVENGRQNLNGMTFNPLPPAGGLTATQATIRFDRSDQNRWDFDPASGRYLRYQELNQDAPGAAEETFEPFLDRLTGQQVAFDNVVILIVPYTVVDRDNGMIDLLFGGVGKAYAFRDGQMFEVNWNRPTEDSVVFLTFNDGTRFPFKPGNTWFEILGQSTTSLEPDPGSWRFVFAIP